MSQPKSLKTLTQSKRLITTKTKAKKILWELRRGLYTAARYFLFQGSVPRGVGSEPPLTTTCQY